MPISGSSFAISSIDRLGQDANQFYICQLIKKAMDKTKYLKFPFTYDLFHTFRMAFPTFCNSQGFSYDYVFDWNTKKNVSGVIPLENGSCSLKTLTAFC